MTRISRTRLDGKGPRRFFSETLKIASISDIHGNLAALEVVLADIAAQSVDVTVNLGDIVSGPLWVCETADRLMGLALPTIAGNHERQLLTFANERMGPTDAHAAALLSEPQRAWLRSLPATLQLSEDVFCCHGTPTNDLQYFLETVTEDFAPGRASGVRRALLTEATARAGGSLLGVPHAVILCGHSHVPRVMRLLDGRLIVNPGSVGVQAYDDVHPHPHDIETGSCHASYALLTRRAAGWQVELRRVPYDEEQAAALAADHGREDWAYALRTGFVGVRTG